ncbi:MAG: alpha-glucosidase/alpha-galactosidase [Oscillospiraceae bacterium]|nr:alpha-glucosidase/alpha-galactosidase [Oscillospiraceae bacterium]
MKTIKIAYIGGGSKLWAHRFMQDLCLAEGIGGEVSLYDIDKEAALRNQQIGTRIHARPEAVSPFVYTVADTLEESLTGADFVLISILPGTFKEMRSDVHEPEKYGIYQAVGDTVGPGGILRAMRTVPIYEGFAKAIKQCCPDAWVLNLTNPMSACVKALYDNFPEIKAFGCCHEVFHAQQFLTCVLKEMKGIEVDRRDIYTDASGVNHFTWITEANYQNIDLLALLPEFMDKFFESGYYERGPHDAWETDPFSYANKVKMDLYRRFGALGAAGDRHLVEFLNNNWYLADPEMVKKWHYGLTTVDLREANQAKQIEDSIAMAKGEKELLPLASGEELVHLLRALLGLEVIVSNVNMPNRGQMPGMPEGSIVETNCVFTNGFVKPVTAKPLPAAVLALVQRNCANIDLTCEGIRERDLDKLFAAFMNQPLCSSLTFEDGKKLFDAMCENTKEYLAPYYPQFA